MGKEKRGPLALELWAKQLINCYPGVSVRNMTTSWRNGLAFCALIHRFRPDLIDYDKLDPSDIIGNCSLAFDIAESKLGICSLLDPVDMAAMDIPDRLSVLTYVAQFYNAFKNLEVKSHVLPSRDENDALENQPSDKSESSNPDKKMVTKRKNEVDEDEIMDKVRRSMPKRSVLSNSSNVCFECKNPVFISERVLFMKKLYHRSCFCCSKCKNPLNPHIVDVSSDGSLFCLEKTCHVELLETTNESSMNTCVPDVNNVRNESDMQNANQSDSSADTQNTSKLNLTTDVVNMGSSIRSEFDTIQEDSHSQGDMQIFQEKHELAPQNLSRTPTTPRSTKKLLDFAGGLLYSNENLSKVHSVPSSGHFEEPNALVEEESKEILGSPVDTNEVVEGQRDLTEPIPKVSLTEEEQEHIANIRNEESESNINLEIKSATEITSIRDHAILTVADQFKVDVEEARKFEENLESESSVTTDEHQLETIPADNEIEIVESIDSSDSVNDPKIVSEIENSNLEPLSNPFGGEEEKNSETDSTVEISKLDSIVSNVTPSSSPIPKQRPPKPPPPKFASSASPTPVPRSRNNQRSVEDPKCTNELWRNKDYYPESLNPFASDEDLPEAIKKEPKNPFEDDDDDGDGEHSVPPTPSPKPRTTANKEVNNNGNNNNGSSPLPRKNAANFNVPPPRPPPPQPSPRKTLLPKEYNPFDDDEDIGEYDNEEEKSLGATAPTDDTSSISSKTSDLSSITTPRSLNASDTEGTGSMKIRSRKSRRAPLPPTPTHPQLQPVPDLSPDTFSEESRGTPERKVIPASPKLMKGLSIQVPRAGITTQRKKRRAPPPKRRVEPLPEETIKTEFADLEVKLKELERQGITLETKIRSFMEEEETNQQPDNPNDAAGVEDGLSENSANEQVDEMMIQLWSIVNEKNDILRRQTELEYLRRGHRLEEMQSEREFKLRMLMDTAEDQRLPNHETMEQTLLQQLLKLVDERNEVVDWLDYHRRQDKEEELMLAKSITEFTTSKAVEPIPDIATSSSKSKSKEKKQKDKSKDDKEKKDGKLRLGIFKKKHKKTKAAETTSAEP